MSMIIRHHGAGRDLGPTKALFRQRSRIKSGMTMLVAVAMLGTFAACSQAEETPAAPAKGGPPPPPDPVTLVSRPNATGGEKAYVEKCIMCHGANGMGFGLLARRAKGFEPDLEKRTDISKDYVIMAARRGIGNMPAIPRGEVSDAELAQIADYLASHKGPSK